MNKNNLNLRHSDNIFVAYACLIVFRPVFLVCCGYDSLLFLVPHCDLLVSYSWFCLWIVTEDGKFPLGMFT